MTEATSTDTYTITALSHEGRGITRDAGKTLFVRDALVGETVTIDKRKRRGQFDEANALDILNPASDRVTPPCIHFGICGGCSLQHMTPNAQIKHKESVLLEQLRHFGNTTPDHVAQPLTGPSTHYRQKARLGIKYVFKKNELLIGFRERGGRFLTHMQMCSILDPRIMQGLPPLKDTLLTLSNFKEIPQVEVACGDEQTAFVLRHLSPFTDADLAQLKAFATETNITVYLQPKGPDTVHRFWPEGEARLQYALPEEAITLKFHPCDFTQVNAEINRKMIAQAMAWLNPGTEDRVLDLFCGLGNFSLPLARRSQHVTGVEGCEKMTARAQDNAYLNSLSNVSFYAADLTQDQTNTPWFNSHYDCALIDPPRSGAKEILEQLAALKIPKLLYVSCNPATLARDAQILCDEMGYTLIKAGVMDMFPHTTHVESMALFIR